jgi:arylsulfatase A-like enzyme
MRTSNLRYLGTGQLPEPAVLRHCVSQYDGELRYVDDQLALIFDELRRRGRYDNALIVLTADHGEMFGEHGRLGHSGRPYHTVLWVPLIVRYPGGPGAGSRSGRSA